MADRFQPTPQSAGSLGPPDRHPPTAIGVATPPPPHDRGRVSRPAPAGVLRRALRAGVGIARGVTRSMRRAVTGLLAHHAPRGSA